MAPQRPRVFKASNITRCDKTIPNLRLSTESLECVEGLSYGLRGALVREMSIYAWCNFGFRSSRRRIPQLVASVDRNALAKQAKLENSFVAYACEP